MPVDISITAEAWGGFTKLGAVWKKIGAASDNDEVSAAGEAMLKAAPPMLKDFHTALARGASPGRNGTVCHPVSARRPGSVPGSGSGLGSCCSCPCCFGEATIDQWLAAVEWSHKGLLRGQGVAGWVGCSYGDVQHYQPHVK